MVREVHAGEGAGAEVVGAVCYTKESNLSAMKIRRGGEWEEMIKGRENLPASWFR